MIRTIWLGFVFLIVLAGVGSFRFAFGHFDTANASAIVRAEVDRAVGKKTVQETFTKIDRPQVASVPYAPDAVESKNVEQISAGSRTTQITPPIIGGNWIDRTSFVTRKSRDRKSRRNVAKIVAGATKNQATAEPRGCQLEDFDAVRWTFNLPTGCHAKLHPSRGA